MAPQDCLLRKKDEREHARTVWAFLRSSEIMCDSLTYRLIADKLWPGAYYGELKLLPSLDHCKHLRIKGYPCKTRVCSQKLSK